MSAHKQSPVDFVLEQSNILADQMGRIREKEEARRQALEARVDRLVDQVALLREELAAMQAKRWWQR